MSHDPKNPITPEDAARIQAAEDKAGKQDFKPRAQRAAQEHVNAGVIPAPKPQGGAPTQKKS
ncbi:MAG: hypothetical protein U1F43_35230 [Myxococcota bacterium]